QGRGRLRQPPLLHRWPGVQPRARGVGSLAERRAGHASHPSRRTSGGAVLAGVKRTLSVDLGAGLVLPTPVLIAAGCAGTGRELSGLIDLHRVGGLVSRTVTLEPQKGSPTPRVAECPAG